MRATPTPPSRAFPQVFFWVARAASAFPTNPSVSYLIAPRACRAQPRCVEQPPRDRRGAGGGLWPLPSSERPAAPSLVSGRCLRQVENRRGKKRKWRFLGAHARPCACPRLPGTGPSPASSTIRMGAQVVGHSVNRRATSSGANGAWLRMANGLPTSTADKPLERALDGGGAESCSRMPFRA